MTDPSLSTACSALSQPGETSTNTCSTTDGCKIDHACSVNISMPARQSDTDRHFVVRAAIKGVEVDCLVDSGATLTAIKPDKATSLVGNDCQIIKLAEPLLILLADGSGLQITHYIMLK